MALYNPGSPGFGNGSPGYAPPGMGMPPQGAPGSAPMKKPKPLPTQQPGLGYQLGPTGIQPPGQGGYGHQALGLGVPGAGSGFRSGRDPGSWEQYSARMGSPTVPQLQPNGSPDGRVPGSGPGIAFDFESGGSSREAQFGELETALQYDRSKQQYEADKQRGRIDSVNTKFGEQLGYAAGRVRDIATGQADHLRSIADEERQLFEQKSAAILSGFKDMTAQKAASNIMAVDRNLQTELSNIDNDPNLTPTQKSQMKQEMAANSWDQRSSMLAQIGTQFNESFAQLATGHLEQSLTSAQMREALHTQAASLVVAAEDAALEYEVGGLVTLANMIRANPYQHFSVAAGFAQMMALRTAGGGGGGFGMGAPMAEDPNVEPSEGIIPDNPISRGTPSGERSTRNKDVREKMKANRGKSTEPGAPNSPVYGPPTPTNS